MKAIGEKIKESVEVGSCKRRIKETEADIGKKRRRASVENEIVER